MNRKLLLICISFCFFLSTCLKNDLSMKDGYYTAEMAEYDASGWKEFVTIRVSGGKIIHVEYDAKNLSGYIKSWDMDYMRIMSNEKGIYPSAYFRYYSGELLQRQSAEGIDAVTGATDSYKLFILLSDAVLESAHLGETGIKLVSYPVSAVQNSIPDEQKSDKENF